MPRGQPDFGMYAPQTYVAGLADMAELAVRLGSIVIFDRRGKVIELDDCESPKFKWWTERVGDGALVLDNRTPKSGGQCIKLTSGTANGNYVRIQKSFAPQVSLRVGMECSFCFPDTDTLFSIYTIWFDGAKRYLASVQIDFNAKTLSYATGWFTFTQFATTDAFFPGLFCYYPIKLVADYEVRKHARLLLADKEYDISAFALGESDSILKPHYTWGVRLDRRANTGGSIYVDDFILTQDEP